MAKILLIDIETAPSRAYIWSLWTEPASTKFLFSDWFMLCWCAKWLDEKKVLSSSLIESKNYKRDSENDKVLVKKVWHLLDEADIVVGHNVSKFDIPSMNTRFLVHGLTPPSPYKIVDTLLIARRSFNFLSNKLGDLSVFLGLGKKLETGGFELWAKCLQGDKQAWKKMVAYCKKDVTLLEKVYLKLRPYGIRQPNIAVYENTEDLICTTCGSPNIWQRGSYYTNLCKYKRYSCKDCGSWSRARKKEDNIVHTSNTI